MYIASFSTYSENIAKTMTDYQSLKDLLATRVLSKNPSSITQETLTTLERLMSNILTHPDEPKYRTFKVSNKLINSTVITVPGALEFLLKCGFQMKVLDFEEKIRFEGDIAVLGVANEIVMEAAAKAKAHAETEKRMLDKEKMEEAGRKAKVLDAINEDRERRRKNAAAKKDTAVKKVEA